MTIHMHDGFDYTFEINTIEQYYFNGVVGNEKNHLFVYPKLVSSTTNISLYLENPSKTEIAILNVS